ncbi:MAG TPA: TAXI family TRAP transporter solute-binding subunit [Methyloceanibacter sp.]|nr:TAXI family TRAP transporter solute-binding subunit [Methyloceanibacter sp.]
MRRVLVGMCFGVIALLAGEDAQAKSPKAWLGLAVGQAAATETLLGADLAALFADSSELRVLPVLGDAGAGNLAALTENPGMDLAFVSSRALAEAARSDPDLVSKLELVVRLPPQEIHLLARRDIATVADLAGKEVSFGPVGSASAASGTALFAALGIAIHERPLDPAAALTRLKEGTLAGALFVGGKPYPQIEAAPIGAGLHLLPIPFDAALDAAYLPAELSADDYPNLIPQGQRVETVATGMLLLACPKGEDARQRIERFTAAFFSRFAELKAEGRHPKWREVNLAATLPGLKRTRIAETWLAERSEPEVKAVAASAAAPPATTAIMGKEEREALFKRFLEWQRSKER